MLSPLLYASSIFNLVVHSKHHRHGSTQEISDHRRQPGPEHSLLLPEDHQTGQKLALRPQPPVTPTEAPRQLSAEEEEALRLSDARIKKYWKEKEDARLYPRGKEAFMSWTG